MIDELAARALAGLARSGRSPPWATDAGFGSSRRSCDRRGRYAHLYRTSACRTGCSCCRHCPEVPRGRDPGAPVARRHRRHSRAFELAPDFQETCGGGMLLEVRGRLRVARGDRAGGITDLRACERVHRGLGFGPPYSFWRSALALALPAQALDEALSLMNEELELAAATGLRPALVASRCAAPAVPPGSEPRAWLPAGGGGCWQALLHGSSTPERSSTTAPLCGGPASERPPAELTVGWPGAGASMRCRAAHEPVLSRNCERQAPGRDGSCGPAWTP